MAKRSQLLSPEAARAQQGVRWLDARSGPGADDAYSRAHVPGAVHIDLDRDLSARGPDAAEGGRHPLPQLDVFCERLGSWGIEPSTPVILYDQRTGAMAASRAWWMLRSVGHEAVWLVNGGYDALVGAGTEMTSDVPSIEPKPRYPATAWQLPIASAEDVDEARLDGSKLVIDVREGARYRGEREPFDPVAGRIPGAKNLPYQQNLDEAGHFRSAAELQSHFHEALGGIDPARTIVHCGSGVTACHTLLAMEESGLSGAALYVGSWSEWCLQDRPLASGPESNDEESDE